jgi:hypothetical protein
VNSTRTFIRVLEKYYLRRPVPPEVRAGTGRAKRDTLRHILRKNGELSVGIRAALPFYRAARRLGAELTFRQGRMISSALAAMVFGVLFAGAWLVTMPIMSPVSPEQGVVVFAMGEVTRTGAGGASASLKARDLLQRGDRITTGEGSTAILQAGGNIMVRLQARSELYIDTLLESLKAEVSISSGTVLARVEKLAKGGSFSVKAPTVVASVRGTAFSVTSGSVDTVVVTEGTVSVKPVKGDEERPLREGSAVEAGTGLKERPMAPAERLEIERVRRLPFIQNPRTAPQSEFDALAELVRKTDVEIDAEIKNLRRDTIPATLEEIRAKYGRIDAVRLYTGETIRGAVVNRGATIKMVIPGRYKSIPRSAVRTVETE